MIKKFTQKFLLILSIAALIIASAPFSNTSNTANAAAVNCDTSFYSNNDILFYNPCATSCSDAPNGTATVVSTLKGDNNGQKIFNFWIDAGLTSQQAAGITGSLQAESGFSPFRQETTQAWPQGGWGIAQFTGGQRVGTATAPGATDFVKAAVGDTLFNQYYIPTYGGVVLPSNGYIPTGVPVSVNDQFLLAELNYLLQTVRSLVPNNIRVGEYKKDFNETIPAGETLYDYIKSLVQTGDTAIAWTYLYEYPTNRKATATVRATNAVNILTLYGDGISTTCGGSLQEGGMTLAQAQDFMNTYKTSADSINYIGGAGRTCSGGPLANCVSLSVYFINKYTTLGGFKSGSTGNGSGVVGNIIARNPTIKSGHSPQPYAIFSIASGNMQCGNTKCGHTGIVLGVDTVNNKIIIGEAACGSALSWAGAHEYPLSKFESDAYTYAYTDGLLKDGLK